VTEEIPAYLAIALRGLADQAEPSGGFGRSVVHRPRLLETPKETEDRVTTTKTTEVNCVGPHARETPLSSTPYDQTTEGDQRSNIIRLPVGWMEADDGRRAELMAAARERLATRHR